MARGRGARCGYAGGYGGDDGSSYGGGSSCGGGSNYGGGSNRGGAPYASHVTMATAATAAVQAGEAEAARLKQRAQRLLRERGAVESEIEDMQATLVRTRRELSATQEQIDSAASERTSLSTADMRRHATQLQALSKAQAREKRRLLAARTQAAKVDKTLEKKREQLAAVHARLEPLRRRLADAPDEAAREAAAKEQLKVVAAREEQLRTARDAATAAAARLAADGGGDGGNGGSYGSDDGESGTGHGWDLPSSGSDGEGGTTEAVVAAEAAARAEAGTLEAKLRVARRAIVAREAALHRQKEREEAAHAEAEAARVHSASAAAAEAADAWRRRAMGLHRRLRTLCAPPNPHFDTEADVRAQLDAAAEAMRWRAEAIAFAAEVRRVEGEQARQEAQRAAEEEGWREFQQASQAELRARGRRTADAQAEAWRLKQLLACSADAAEPPASAATARQLAAVQQALREERERLRQRAAEASEMRRLRDQLQAELDESTGKCAMLQRSVRGLNEQVTSLTHFAI